MASNERVESNWQALAQFSNEMKNFAARMDDLMQSLSKKTSAITDTAWRDQQGARFAQSIEFSRKNMSKTTAHLRDLSDAIHEKAIELRQIAELKPKP